MNTEFIQNSIDQDMATQDFENAQVHVHVSNINPYRYLWSADRSDVFVNSMADSAILVTENKLDQMLMNNDIISQDEINDVYNKLGDIFNMWHASR